MRGSSKTTPVLSKSGVLAVADGKSISVGSEMWFSWLGEAQTFYYEGEKMGFTVRSEKRRRRIFWYAFKKIAGKTNKKYIGNNQSLTLEVLQTIEQDWYLLIEPSVNETQVIQHSEFPKEVLYTLFDDEHRSAYLAWDNPEIRYRARAGLYFIRHGEWLFEIQNSGEGWQIFAFSDNRAYTEDIEFDNLK